jgi:hypothetical protein
MPEYRFSYSGKTSVPQIHGITAKDIDEACEKRYAFLTKNGGKYVKDSMREFNGSTWQKVIDFNPMWDFAN